MLRRKFFNIYHRNERAVISGSNTVTGSLLSNVYDSMMELRADFTGRTVTINGKYENIAAIDSLCLGNTNADWYELTTREGTCRGKITGWISVYNFDETQYIDSFTLRLGYNDEEDADPLYLGYLFLGKKTRLPRFGVGPQTGTTLRGESSRSFGGQVYGMKRRPLDGFAADFPRLTADEYREIKEYVNAVQNVEPHIIDPYHEAREEFPPMHVTLDMSEVSLTKQNEDGFYYSGKLAWKEAR